MNDLARLARQRENLMQELAKIRRSSMHASERGDFRAVARFTLEAARLNRAISDTQAKEQALR
jgi:hypothetical protein